MVVVVGKIVVGQFVILLPDVPRIDAPRI